MTHKKQLVVYSFSHFAVDFACFFILMGSFYFNVTDITMAIGCLIYNFIAFTLQVPIGYIVDIIKIKHSYITIFGCLLVAIGIILSIFPFCWVALCFCALGNAVFHIGGGVDSLVNANGKNARVGIFISTGAIGVALGTIAGKIWRLSVWPVIILVILCIFLQSLLCKSEETSYTASFKFNDPILKQASLIIYVILFAILMRAVVSVYIPITWKTTAFLIILPAVCIFAGKFLGGILADIFGARNIALISLIISAPLLAFFSDDIYLCCIGLLFFNMTTAITACVVASKLPDNPAFSFGLTTFALFIGTAFCSIVFLPLNIAPYLLLTFILLAILCMLLTTSNKGDIK